MMWTAIENFWVCAGSFKHYFICFFVQLYMSHSDLVADKTQGSPAVCRNNSWFHRQSRDSVEKQVFRMNSVVISLPCLVFCVLHQIKKKNSMKSWLRSAIIECNMWLLTFLVCSVSLAIEELPLDKYQTCLAFKVQDLGGSNSIGSSKIIIFRAHAFLPPPPLLLCRSNQTQNWYLLVCDQHYQSRSTPSL